MSLIQVADLYTISILVTFILFFLHLIIFRQCVSITFQCALVSIINRKIALMSEACSKPPIIIKFYDLHVNNIKRVVSEITSYHGRELD